MTIETTIADLQAAYQKNRWALAEAVHGIVTGSNYSLREIAKHPGCPCNRSQLLMLAQAWVVRLEMGGELPAISPQHVATLVDLAPEERPRALERAASGCWTWQELRSYVATRRERY